MKNLMKVLAVSMLLLAIAVLPALAEEPDAFTSASVASFYGDTALTGDDLMNAINSASGFYQVTSVNPNGTPNAAVFIFGMSKLEDKYYLQMGLAENQTRQNLLENGEGVAVYAKTPSTEAEAKPYAVAGARMRFQLVTDEKLVETLSATGRPGALYFEVVEVKPLG